MAERVPIYVSYEEARRLIPFFEAAHKNPPFPEARESAWRILSALRSVRKDVDYSPLSGQQLFLIEGDKEWVMSVMEIMGL